MSTSFELLSACPHLRQALPPRARYVSRERVLTFLFPFKGLSFFVPEKGKTQGSVHTSIAHQFSFPYQFRLRLRGLIFWDIPHLTRTWRVGCTPSETAVASGMSGPVAVQQWCSERSSQESRRDREPANAVQMPDCSALRRAVAPLAMHAGTTTPC